MLTINCLECGNNNQLECIDCNLQVTDCACLLSSGENYVGYLCHGCMQVTEVDIAAYLEGDTNCLLQYDDLEEYANYTYNTWDDTEDDIEEAEIVVDFSDPKDWDWSYSKDDEGQHWRTQTKTWSKCRHYNHPLEFPDGTVVYPSSHTDRYENEPTPDFGLYLDQCWEPAGMAGYIAWPDYGSPKFPVAAAHSIVDAFQKAKEGLWVEVGCIGGHGRTGTALACMAVLAGVKPKNAVKWVKKNYCSHAVESSVQEWYVEFFGCFINGGTITEPDYNSYDKGEKSVVPGQEYTFPDAQLDWESIDFIRTNAAGTPPKELLDPDKFFQINENKFTTKEKIRIVNSNSPDAQSALQPF